MSDVSARTADLAGVFRSAIERAGMRLVVDCAPVPDPVYLDAEMWEKIVFNLLSNAFKYTFAGEIHVSVQQTGQTVEFSVRDTGVGIPEAELDRVFDRFHRVEGVHGRTSEGTGIGLALGRDGQITRRLDQGSEYLRARKQIYSVDSSRQGSLANGKHRRFTDAVKHVLT